MNINGTEIKTPKALTVDLENIDIKHTTASGKIIIDRVRNKYILEAEWGALTDAEYTAIKNAINANAIFQVEFPNGTGNVSAFFCCSSLSAPKYSNVDGVISWKGLSATFEQQ